MGKDSKNEVIGNMENMKIVRNKLKVLARSRPNDKYIMVTGLRHLGDIVAVLIIHILILRYLCEGLLKREFDLFGGEESSVEGVICDKDGIDKRCDGKIGFYI